MPYPVAAKNSMLNSLAGKTAALAITALSIHTNDPGLTGSSEVSGGGYARVSVSGSDWTVANGESILNNDKTFSGPSGGLATYFGTWAGTTFCGGGAITGNTAFNASNQFVLQTGTRFDLNA